MPNIIIKEYDKTKAGYAEYENFAVVVPGFCGKTSPTGFDDNGIFECHSQKEFVEKIGKKAGDTQSQAAKCAEPENMGSAETPVYSRQLSAKEFYSTYANKVYTAEEVNSNPPNGKLIWKTTTKTYKFTKAEDYELTEDYYIILTGNEGKDAVTLTQNGNQIAYELLGLGYTVLYKKLDNETEYGTDKIKGTAALNTPEFWAPLKDKSTYDFRYICTGGCAQSGEAYKQIINIARYINSPTETQKPTNGRGDCIALLDVDESSITIKNQTEFLNKVKTIVDGYGLDNNDSNDSKYCAIFAPQVNYDLAEDIEYTPDGGAMNKTFPASFHYLACAAKARENNYDEWFAIAGYNRGISKYKITDTTIILGEIAVEKLQQRKINDSTTELARAINLVIKERNGYFLWGNRTGYKLDTNDSTVTTGLRASHFLNIRQLCCTLKKDLYVACRQFTFDPNSDVLWINFCNTIRPTLEAMKANQGIIDYKIIKCKSPVKALLTAKIRIIPIEAVEDFDISIYLEDSITGVNVTAED